MDLKNKMLIFYGLLTLTVVAMWTSARITKTIEYEMQEQVRSKPKPMRMKYILQWMSVDWHPILFWGKGQEEFFRRKCKVNDCYVTSRRYLLESIANFDMIAFHGPELVGPLQGPRWRSPHQKYVFVSMESSHNYPVCYDSYDNYFNWTFTYRLDSDLPYTYIIVRNSTHNIIGPYKTMHWMDVNAMKHIGDETKELLSTKNKAAAWLVSNCNSMSKRLKYASSLRCRLADFGLELDIFGGCGPNKCPLNKMDACLKMIEREYYFYLSFENSFSEDYVTEKLLWPLQNYAVPVVFGRANYTRFMPDGIYLNGGKMTPAALAKEMSDIMHDKERYYRFFKWRNHYSYHAPEEAPETDRLCRLCAMLHDETLMNKKMVYTHFRRWWNDYASC